MVDEIKDTWAALPAMAKRGAFVGALLLSLLSGGAVGSVMLPQGDAAPRLERLEANDARQDTAIAELQGQAPRTEYLFCVDASDRGLIPDSPQDCYRRYQFRREP